MRGNIRGEKLAKKTKKLKEEPLYECPTCGATAHINKKNRQLLINFTISGLPTKIMPFKAPVTISFPSHDDCELGKPVDKIDLKKLEKVKVKKR